MSEGNEQVSEGNDSMSSRRQEVTIAIKQLGQRIRELRRILSLTQEELAARAQISVSFLSMMERGDRVPHLETLAKLADALRVPLPEMFLELGETAESSPRLLDSLIEYLEYQPLDADDVEVLLAVAKAIFKDKRPSSSP